MSQLAKAAVICYIDAMLETHRLERYITEAMDCEQTALGRLIFLGSVRDAYTGRYLHEGWSAFSSPAEVHSMLRGIHQTTFGSLLRISVLDLSKELRIHFRSLNHPEKETSAVWLELEPFRDLIPAECSPVLRALFISQIRTALEVLCRAPGWSQVSVPTASPHRRPVQPAPLPWLN